MVIFANGTKLNTIAVYGGTMQFQSAQRKTLEIVCASSEITLDDAKKLYQDSVATAEITVESEGETSVQLNFTLPVELKLTMQDEVEVIKIKLAQKSALEIAQEQQANELAATQMAVLELAAMAGGV